MFWNKNKKSNLGRLGEKAAAKYLKQKGYEIIARNFQNAKGKRVGEIDIIAKEKGQFVFVEVKTREMEDHDGILPEESITRQKLYKLRKIAEVYIRENNLWDFPYRFDAVSVWVSQDQKTAKVKHLKSIFL